jgi:hypothetical protein
MMKSVSAVLGIGLLILTIAGWATTGAVAWLAWLDLVGALCAFWVAYSADETTNARVGGSVALGIGLLVLWIIAQSSMNTPAWQSWWTFAFGCAFVILGIADYFGARSSTPHVASRV